MKQETYYFTFGFGQAYPNCFTIIAAKSYGDARDKMFAKYGREWASQYSKKEWFDKKGISQEKKFNLKQI